MWSVIFILIISLYEQLMLSPIENTAFYSANYSVGSLQNKCCPLFMHKYSKVRHKTIITYTKVRASDLKRPVISVLFKIPNILLQLSFRLFILSD